MFHGARSLFFAAISILWTWKYSLPSINFSNRYHPKDNDLKVSITHKQEAHPSPDEDIFERRDDNVKSDIVVELNGKLFYTLKLTLDKRLHTIEAGLFTTEAIHQLFVPAKGLSRNVIAELWDTTNLTDQESTVNDALRIIEPKIERVGISFRERRSRSIVPRVRVQDSKNPLPLSSLGEGMNRLFGVALAIVNAKDGFLLIDEIESGLHYSVMVDMWRLVFQIAYELDVQVFATTHSRDCIEAFQIAAAQHPSEGVLISLRRHRDRPQDIVAILVDEQQLETVTREHIEVR
ncbi:MAG: ATP-binding protein [Chloroflexaceae bacterium]|nr:ATP-binding protein [Chloroflexaceae bacterium]